MGIKKEMELWLFYQEKLIKHSDKGNALISNKRAKIVLGSYLRLESYVQPIMLDILEEKGFIRRANQREIEILPVKFSLQD